MIISRAEHPSWLSNAYLIADRDGGHGVLVDSNGVEDRCSKRLRTVASRSRTCSSRTRIPTTSSGSATWAAGSASRCSPTRWPSRSRASPARSPTATSSVPATSRSACCATPGHCRDHLALLVDGTDCLTADCLFKGTVGGTMGGGESGYADQVHSIMQVLMALPHETRLHPGHVEPTTVGDEWEYEPVHPHLARRRPRGHGRVHGARRAGHADPVRAPTTTARTRRACGSPTAATRSSAARPSEARRDGNRGAVARRGVVPRGLRELAVRRQEAVVVPPHHLVVPLQARPRSRRRRGARSPRSRRPASRPPDAGASRSC